MKGSKFWNGNDERGLQLESLDSEILELKGTS